MTDPIIICAECGAETADLGEHACVPRIEYHMPPADVEPTKGFRDHWNVFLDAHAIHVQRTQKRGDQWRQEGLRKMAECAEDKARRIRIAIDNGLMPVLDDAYDLVNYGAFCARHIKEGNIDPSARQAKAEHLLQRINDWLGYPEPSHLNDARSAVTELADLIGADLEDSPPLPE